MQKLISIRSGRDAEDPLKVQNLPNWGSLFNKVFNTGPSTLFYNRMPIEQQFEILLSNKPRYLLLYPSNIFSLSQYCNEKGQTLPDIHQIITYGEPQFPAIRKACHEVFNVSIADMYSSEETGYIALQCPENDHYHIQSESVLVEVLNDQNQQCQPGEIGRVVLTSLYNFAMPLIRYDIGDYAEVGATCPCGRGLPVLNRILGRVRNAITHPDGSYHWPDITKIIHDSDLPIKQLQIIQKDKTNIDVYFTVHRSLDTFEQETLHQRLQNILGNVFHLSMTMHDDIPRHPNGKFEYVINEMNVNKENTT